MKLNRIEKALMNNPVRALVQRHHEAALLERLGGRVEGARILEIGCGRGVGTEIIFERFGAREVHAFDVDPDMIAQARKRLFRYPANRLSLFVGDAAAIKAEDVLYDAVFDFEILHHVPDWQRAVAEVARVLKPGGRFFFEEVTRHALDRWFYRTFLDHPKTNRFSDEEFVTELETLGIIVGANQIEWFFGDFVIGVGRRLSGVSELQLKNQTNYQGGHHMSTAQHTDPVCGMQVEADSAAGQSEYKGQTYYFCNPGCKRKFDENPEAYVGESQD